MAKPNKIPHNEEKDSRLKGLKNRIRKLESEVRKLKSENNTLNGALQKTYNFLRDDLKNFSVEELIKAANNDESKKEIHKKEVSPSADSKVSNREYWNEWKKKNLRVSDTESNE